MDARMNNGKSRRLTQLSWIEREREDYNDSRYLDLVMHFARLAFAILLWMRLVFDQVIAYVLSLVVLHVGNMSRKTRRALISIFPASYFTRW